MPKPGPRTPAAHAPVPVAAPPKNDPSKFGRIDDTGAVFVTTSAGEREIGSWQAGTIEEGLEHFGTRFDDLATEVELFESRLKAHPEEAGKIRKRAEQIKTSLPDAAVIGDLDALDERLSAVLDHTEKAGKQAQADKERRRADAIAAKEKLLVEAEDIAENSEEWKAAGNRLRAILEEWKTIRGIDRETDDVLWKRYSTARDSFDRRRGSHFADLDRQRLEAKKKKEDLIVRAEAMQNSTEWGETARAYRDLMKEWKASGRAPRDVDDKLWAQFRAAQDHFFDARNAVNEERDREYVVNAEAKDALLADYEAQIAPEKNLSGARAKLSELQDKWEEIGYVPRDRVREYEDKISAVEKRVADAEQSQWRRADPEAQAMVDQFASKVEDFTAQAEAAEKAGKSSKAEQLRGQAQQWQEWADTARKTLED